jgi:hypothetical protein
MQIIKDKIIPTNILGVPIRDIEIALEVIQERKDRAAGHNSINDKQEKNKV